MNRFKEEIQKRDSEIKYLREQNDRMKSVLRIFADVQSYKNGGIPVRAEYIANFGLYGMTEPDAPQIKRRKFTSILKEN